MKKISYVIVSIILTFSLGACTQKSEIPLANDETSQQEVNPKAQQSSVPKNLVAENVSIEQFGSSELNSYIFETLIPTLSKNDMSIIENLRSNSESFKIDKNQFLKILQVHGEDDIISMIDSHLLNVSDMIYLCDINNDSVDDLLFIEHGGSMGNDTLHYIYGVSDNQFDFENHVTIDALRTEPRFFKVINNEFYMIRLYFNINYKQLYKIAIEKIVDDRYFTADFEVSDVQFQKIQKQGESSFWDTYIENHKMDFTAGNLYESTSLDESCIDNHCTHGGNTYAKSTFIPSTANTHFHLTISEDSDSTGVISKVLELNSLSQDGIILDESPLLEFMLEDSEEGTVIHLLQYQRSGNLIAKGYKILSDNDVTLLYDIEYQKAHLDFSSK